MNNRRVYLEAFVIIDGKRVNLKVIDFVNLSMILTDKVIEGLEKAVKETVKCAECKYLTLVNQKDCYARCEKTKQKFLPFGIDTREHTCEYAEKQNEVTEND